MYIYIYMVYIYICMVYITMLNAVAHKKLQFVMVNSHWWVPKGMEYCHHGRTGWTWGVTVTQPVEDCIDKALSINRLSKWSICLSLFIIIFPYFPYHASILHFHTDPYKSTTDRLPCESCCRQEPAVGHRRKLRWKVRAKCGLWDPASKRTEFEGSHHWILGSSWLNGSV